MFIEHQGRCTVTPRFLQVADFGFAVQMGENSFRESLRGSPLYIAPEMWDKKYDARWVGIARDTIQHDLNKEALEALFLVSGSFFFPFSCFLCFFGRRRLRLASRIVVLQSRSLERGRHLA